MLKYIIFLSLIFSSFAQIPCRGGCKKCVYVSPERYECTECIDGYVFDNKKYDNEGCIKKCVETQEETGCKICNEKETFKCQQCWEEHNYILDDREIKCLPKFQICRGTKFFDCYDCESKVNNDSSITSRCIRCREHYILVDGLCEYDFDYQKSITINGIMLLLIIILLL